MQPGNVIAEDTQTAFDNWATIVDDEAEAISNTIISQVIGNTSDALKEYRNTAMLHSDLLYIDAVTQESYALDLIRNGGDDVDWNRVDRIFESSADSYGKSWYYFDEGLSASLASDILTGVSIYMDASTVIENAKTVITGDFNNEHSSLRALEATLLVADGTLAGIGLVATLTGATLATPVVVAGIVVGLTATLVHSEGFANFMNSTSNGVLDFFDNLIESMFPWMKTPDGVNCYKPNIYIYDEEGRKIDLTFSHPQLIIKSIPDYETGWSVTASGEGILTTEDGEACTYLFYESRTVKGMFETQKGFYMNAENRVAEWERILSEYGFNELEIQDFIEFWNEMLEADKDYIMYPQYTETVDKAMEVTITPAPENIVRIWFVFEEYDGQEYEEEVIVPFTREGYTVVEWGGMVFE